VDASRTAFFCTTCGQQLKIVDGAVVLDARPRTPSVDARVGTTVAGRYKLLRVLGSGGMGAVYAAEQTNLGREVAVKLIKKSLVDEPGVIERFILEAKSVARLNHPNIITLHDFGEDVDGSLYICMELVQGVSLRDRMKNGPIPWAHAARIAGELCEALAAVHAKNILHRDLKPENVMLADVRGKELVKLLDFGIAKLDEHSSTVTHHLVGTPGYLAPEIHDGVKHARGDLYALGVVLFEMLTGRAPFYAQSVMALMMKHVVEPVPTMASVAPNVDLGPPALSALVMSLLAKRAEDRPVDADAVRAILSDIVAQQSSASTPLTAGAATETMPSLQTPKPGTPATPVNPGASQVQVRDYMLWTKHVTDRALAQFLDSVGPGTVVTLWVDGVKGEYEKMRDRPQGATPGLKPIGATLSQWKTLYPARQHEYVSISRSAPSDSSARRTPPPAGPGVVVHGTYRLIEELLGAKEKYDAEQGDYALDVYRVFVAEQMTLGRQVVLKLFEKRGLLAEVDLRTAIDDVKRIGALQQRNIVRILDSGFDDDGSLYVASELVMGDSLDQLLVKGALPVSTSIAIARGIADALAAAHVEGVVHAGLVPAGITVVRRTGDVTPMILDFGVAESVRAQVAKLKLDALKRKLVTAHPVGYSAPERHAGTVAASGDLYALGCILYEMLTGQPLFKAPTALAVVTRHALDAPPRLAEPPAHASAAVWDGLDAVLASLLRKDPQERPRDAALVAGQLRALAEISSV
jgi:serine/threonine protein kinase